MTSVKSPAVVLGLLAGLQLMTTPRHRGTEVELTGIPPESIVVRVPNAALCKEFLMSLRRAPVLGEIMVGRFPGLLDWLNGHRKRVV